MLSCSSHGCFIGTARGSCLDRRSLNDARQWPCKQFRRLPTPLSSVQKTKRSVQILFQCQSTQGKTSDDIVQKQDIVSIHFTAYGEQGDRLQSTKDAGQQLTFEVGTSTAVNNGLLHLFDGAVLGMRVGDTRRVALESVQDEWDENLIFNVPSDHTEIQRLEGKFRSSGGLTEGMIVELSNGQQAQVVKISSQAVILDANNATAGRKLSFDVEVVALDRPQA